MAISVGILHQIILVTTLSQEEVAQGFQLDRKWRPKAGLNLVKDRAGHRQIFRTGIINPCAITGSLIFPLFVETKGIDCAEEIPNEFSQGQGIRVVYDPDSLSIASRVRVDLLIGRRRGVTIGEAHLGVHDTLYIPEIMLRTPETAAGKINLFHRPASSSMDSRTERK